MDKVINAIEVLAELPPHVAIAQLFSAPLLKTTESDLMVKLLVVKLLLLLSLILDLQRQQLRLELQPLKYYYPVLKKVH